MTNERSIESVILHAKGLVTEAEEDDGWVMIASGLLSMLLGEIERLRRAAEPRGEWSLRIPEPPAPVFVESVPKADPAKLEFALRGLYWDHVDYLTLNKLGGMNNHWMRAAREALGMDPDDTRPAENRTGES